MQSFTNSFSDTQFCVFLITKNIPQLNKQNKNPIYFDYFMCFTCDSSKQKGQQTEMWVIRQGFFINTSPNYSRRKGYIMDKQWETPFKTIRKNYMKLFVLAKGVQTWNLRKGSSCCPSGLSVCVFLSRWCWLHSPSIPSSSRQCAHRQRRKLLHAGPLLWNQHVYPAEGQHPGLRNFLLERLATKEDHKESTQQFF